MALTYHRARWPKVTPTQQQYGIVARERTSIGFKLAVCGDSGAGGLVAPLPCTAYFGKLAICDRLWEKGPLGSGDQFIALSERTHFVLSNAL